MNYIKIYVNGVMNDIGRIMLRHTNYYIEQ